jgi:crotonobetainyl-CoA:carnitine CoA-transferase CaiB-like acyl-CoA transferase
VLSNLRIVEVGDFISAPFCTKMFADLGAEVIKIEEPRIGDSSRRYGPFFDDRPDKEASGLFLCLNTNKIGLTLNLSTSQGREIMDKLLKEADIFVTNISLDLRKKWELGYNDLISNHPSLIYCSITPYGTEGPYKNYKGFDLQCCALSGSSWAIGYPEREPLQMPLSQCDYQAGINGAAASMAALIGKKKSDRGQYIDISASDVMASYVGSNAILYIFYGLQWRRAGRRAYGSGGFYPYGIFQCKDGYVCIICRTKKDWNNFIEAIGHPDWADNPRYQNPPYMGREYPDEVDSLLEPILIKLTKEDLFKLARKWQFPLAPVRNIQEAIKEPQLSFRKFFSKVDHPNAGTFFLPTPPYHFSDRNRIPIRHAPLLGEHNNMIYEDRLAFSTKKLNEQNII